jgi:hypothetical protein
VAKIGIAAAPTRLFGDGVTKWQGFAISLCVKTRYPLEALRVLREARADSSARHLAAAEMKARAAAAELLRSESALAQARAANTEAAQQTRRELEAGLTRVADLMQAGDFARAGTAREQCLSESERAARRRDQEAARARHAAQLALGGARSELSALERHRDEWRAARAREGAAQEEEAALERWNAERFGPGRR